MELEDHAGKHLYKVPTIPKEVVKYEEPVDLDQLSGWIDAGEVAVNF